MKRSQGISPRENDVTSDNNFDSTLALDCLLRLGTTLVCLLKDCFECFRCFCSFIRLQKLENSELIRVIELSTAFETLQQTLHSNVEEKAENLEQSLYSSMQEQAENLRYKT